MTASHEFGVRRAGKNRLVLLERHYGPGWKNTREISLANLYPRPGGSLAKFKVTLKDTEAAALCILLRVTRDADVGLCNYTEFAVEVIGKVGSEVKVITFDLVKQWCNDLGDRQPVLDTEDLFDWNWEV